MILDLKKIILIFYILMISSFVFAEGMPDITATVDREEIKVGDRVNLEVIIEGAEGKDLSLPEEPQNSGAFTFLGSQPITKGFPKEKVIGRKYTFTVYDTGEQVIPPIFIKYKTSEGVELLQSPQVPLKVESVLTGDETDIRDIKGLQRLPSRKKQVSIILLALLIAGAVSVIVYLKRDKLFLGGDTFPRSAYDIAYEQLKDLKKMDLPGKGMVQEYYVRLTDIVRHYLENRYSYRAPEMTTEEFLAYVKDQPELIKEIKEILGKFLMHADMVKFAKYGPTPLEMLDTYKEAENIVERTRPAEEEEEAEGK